MMSLQVGSEVTCRVDRLYAQKAEITVLAVGESIISNPIRGSIRLQDARSFDIDKASISDHFQPGDIVKASTISVGDARSCFFSTLSPDHGVVVAKDVDGKELFPVDQSHMKNEDGIVFRRKVARPVWFDRI
jgi:exosome complex component CSL4